MYTHDTICDSPYEHTHKNKTKNIPNGKLVPKAKEITFLALFPSLVCGRWTEAVCRCVGFNKWTLPQHLTYFQC